jgi:molybdopterin molybdotransferase
MGLEPRAPRPIGAGAGFDELRRPGRDEFVPVTITGWDNDGRPQVDKRRTPGSARLSSLIGADGLARIPGQLTAVRRGEPLKFYPFQVEFGL